MKKFIYTISFLNALCFCTFLYASVITARVDRNPIRFGETVKINFSLPSTISSPANLVPLEKDFSIIGTSNSRKVSIINGQRRASEVLSVIVMPKHSGRLQIPAIYFGSTASQALSLTVNQQGSSNTVNNNGSRLFLNASIDNVNPYVQSQLLYTVKLYFNVDLQNGALQDPSLPNAVIMRLGNDTRYNSVVDGEQYQVLERHYAIFPEHSGAAIIAPPTFKGSVLSTDPNNTFSGMSLSTSHLMTASAKPIHLLVKPIPNDFKNTTWLPARQLSLTQSFTPQSKAFHVGDPITRTITLTATGINAAQLPTITSAAVAQVNQYSEPAKTSERIRDNSIVTRNIVKIAYVPTQQGNINLPEIRIPWFNTQTQQIQIAKLPAKTLLIKANKANSLIMAPTQPNATVQTKPQLLAPASQSVKHSQAWMWTALGLGLAWLVTMLLWWRNRSPKTLVPVKDSPPEIKLNLKQSKRLLLDLRGSSDARRIAMQLIAYARTVKPDANIHTLNDIAALINDEVFHQQCQALQQSLYSPNAATWSSSALIDALIHHVENPINKPQKSDEIQALNPISHDV